MRRGAETAESVARRAREAGTSRRVGILEAWGEQLVRDRAADDPVDAGWAEILASAVDDSGLDLSQRREVLGVVAWSARAVNLSDPLRAVVDELPDDTSLSVVYLAGFLRRYDFRFASLAQLVHLARRRFGDDALLECLSVYAGLGTNDPAAPARLDNAMSRDDLDWDCRFVLVQGMWLSTSLPDGDVKIIRLSDEIIARGEETANVYFWRSGALRRAGRYDEALTCADQALASHALRDNAVHQDYMRERELVVAMRALDDHVTRRADEVKRDLEVQLDEHLENARQEFARRAAAAEDVVSRSLTGLVEILGLFLAIVVFLGGSGYLAFTAGDFWGHLAAVGLLGAGSVLFFLTLRWVLRPRRE